MPPGAEDLLAICVELTAARGVDQQKTKTRGGPYSGQEGGK